MSVNIGVPQGSVFSLLLFLLYINDLPENLSVACKLLADDVKLFDPIFKNSNISMKNSIDLLSNWSKIWQLYISSSKSFTLHVGKNNPEFPYLINEDPILSVSVIKDLGISYDKNLSFVSHMNNIVKSAQKIFNLN